MDRWRRLSFRVRGLWTQQTQDADLIEEMQGHLDRLIAGYLADGLSLDEARRRAALRFGSLPSLHEQARDERRLRVIEYVARDARYAIRQLFAHRGFAATAILSLSLGIGASVSIFSAVNAILLRDLALPDADQLAVVRVRRTMLHDRIVADCVATFDGPPSAIPDILNDLRESLAEDAATSLACDQAVAVLGREWDRLRDRRRDG